MRWSSPISIRFWSRKGDRMSTRGLVAGLDAAHPLGWLLPAMYQEDEFAQRFTGALDTVLAPLVTALDNLDAYVDPALAPPDFLEWLAS